MAGPLIGLDLIWRIAPLLRPSMARPDSREVLAWALFAAVTALYVHSTSQLELCMAQFEISRADMRASTSFSTHGDSGPRNQGNAGLSTLWPSWVRCQTFATAHV